MSLWLQAVTEDLASGHYAHFRRELLPIAPIPVPSCLTRELRFAERRCRNEADRLFPIRFLWLMEANEQRMFSLPALGRSQYHPEKLLDLWNRASADPQYRRERKAEGFQFDFAEDAIQLSAGWVYIGKQFAEDLKEVEAVLGVELLFPDPLAPSGRPAFESLKRKRCVGPETREAEIRDLLEKLRIANMQRDRNAGKRHRKRLRTLGHRGGLRGTTAER